MEIKISNFKLNVFRNLMEQSLIVDNQLMFEFSTDFVRSCSFSATKSFMKLWTSPLINFIQKSEDSEELQEIPSFDPFNMYILKGDLFKKFLSVHTSDTVDLIFTIVESENKKNQAAAITIIGQSEGSNKLRTTFTLTTEELISNKIDDYAAVIKECTPSNDMCEFVLSDNQIQEIKRLIKKLHKSSADNTAYLSFKLDVENKKVVVNDKVFIVEFDINSETESKLLFPEKSFSFNILKSDFIITGNQTFTIFTNEQEQKVIFGARHAGAIIWCLSSKIEESNDLPFDSSVVDSTIDSIDNLDDYLNDI